MEVNGICAEPRNDWPAIELKKLATWLSIEMISVGPRFEKLVAFESEFRRSCPPSAFVWNVTLTAGVSPPGPKSCTDGFGVQSAPKQMASWALARFRSEVPIWTPAAIVAVSVIGLEIVPAAVTLTASGPSSPSGSMPSAAPVSCSASVAVPAIVIDPELIDA